MWRLGLPRLEIGSTHLDDRYLRDVLISTAAVHVRRGEYVAANHPLQKFLHYFRDKHVTGQREQQRYIRILMLHAQDVHQSGSRIQQWLDALTAWQNVVFAAET
jgi:hypothetical protein